MACCLDRQQIRIFITCPRYFWLKCADADGPILVRRILSVTAIGNHAFDWLISSIALPRFVLLASNMRLQYTNGRVRCDAVGIGNPGFVYIQYWIFIFSIRLYLHLFAVSFAQFVYLHENHNIRDFSGYFIVYSVVGINNNLHILQINLHLVMFFLLLKRFWCHAIFLCTVFNASAVWFGMQSEMSAACGLLNSVRPLSIETNKNTNDISWHC